jgi:hypothetical protein
VSSWGATNITSNTPSDTLKTVWMMIIDVEHCLPRVSFNINEDQFCAFQNPEISFGSVSILNYCIYIYIYIFIYLFNLLLYILFLFLFYI